MASSISFIGRVPSPKKKRIKQVTIRVITKKVSFFQNGLSGIHLQYQISGPLGLSDIFDDNGTSTEFLHILYGDLTIRA
jgi:hypothetical protein